APTVSRVSPSAFRAGGTGRFPRPRFGKPAPLSRYRPDLPAWLDAVIGKALAVDRTQRFGDVIEFAHELENGAMWAKPAAATKPALYDRNPLLFWKLLSAGLIVLVIVLLAWR